MKTVFKAIVFDCDGVLIDTIRPHYEIVTQYINARGVPLDTDTLISQYSGAMLRDILALFAEKYGMPNEPAFHDEIVAAELHYDNTVGLEPTKGVEAFFRSLTQPKAIASNTFTARLQEHLAHYGWQEDFPLVIGADMAGKPKPAPDLYLLAMEKLGVAPEDTLIIEDSHTGVRSGVAAGATVFGYTGVYPDKEARKKMLLAHGASAVFDSYAEMKAAIS